MKEVIFNSTKIKYSLTGTGKVLVLLHGYLESLEVWNRFGAELAKHFKVIAVDLPGHGNSGILGEIHNMELMAESVKAVLDQENVSSCFMVGHSMGGYAALAFAQLFPKYLSGFSLLHSTPFPDTEEKKYNRLREIELVNAGKKSEIISLSIPRTFAPANLTRMNKEVQNVLAIANQTTPEGICACLKGMMQRPDRRLVIINSTVPILLVAGRNDLLIPFKTLEESSKLSPEITFHPLENSGHMGFLEEQETLLKIYIEFIKQIKD